MRMKVTVDLKGWNHVVNALATMSGKDLKSVVDAETSEILAQSSNRKSTKIADKTGVVSREYPVGLNFIGYTGNKKGFTVKAGKAGITKTTTYYLEHRLPDAVWNYIFQKTKDETQEAFGNVGLNKGQFAHFHDGLKLPSPKKGFQTQALNFLKLRRTRLNGKTEFRQRGVGKEYENFFRSNLSNAIRFGGSARSLKSVMRARLNKFKNAIKKGTFKEIKKRTRAYPLIFGK
jgi:uncharacterized ubiquitin-like protein YukD